MDHFVSVCACDYSLSEQITPAENRAVAFWQVTVLWCWHWLRDISSPVHFTPLITISVTLLLSQYHVSLANTHQNNKHRQTVVSSLLWREWKSKTDLHGKHAIFKYHFHNYLKIVLLSTVLFILNKKITATVWISWKHDQVTLHQNKKSFFLLHNGNENLWEMCLIVIKKCHNKNVFLLG